MKRTKAIKNTPFSAPLGLALWKRDNEQLTIPPQHPSQTNAAFYS
jgi:hypothetical protein